MGKPNAPLHFATTFDFYTDHETEFRELVEKGHQVSVLPRDTCEVYLGAFDIFLDPLAWRTWTDPVTKRIANLDMAIKAARVAKKLRGKEKK